MLIYSRLNTGGVETLIIRMSSWLVAHGHKVKMVLENQGDLDHLLDSRIEVKYFKDKYYFLFAPLLNYLLIKNEFFLNVDVIYSFESTTCLLASLIHRNLKNKPAFLTGVYQPNEYYSSASEKKQKRHLPEIMQRMVIKMTPHDSVLFMNENNKKCVEKNLGIGFENENIFPLPVNIQPIVLPGNRTPAKFKIVTVGRLIYFKTYNFHLLDVINKLKHRYPDLRLEIYGYGLQEGELVKKIREMKLEQYVTFKGKLDYNDLASILADAYLFVGMGTALVEAARCGVPSIVAVFRNPKPTCYGFIYNQKGFNVGEEDKEQPEIPLESVIEKALLWSDEQYKSECVKNAEHAERFDIDKTMNEFVKYSEKDGIDELHYLGIFSYYLYFLRYVLIKIIKRYLKKMR